MQSTSADTSFDRQVRTKDEVPQRAVAALTETGHAQAAYLQGVREREGRINTYLGNGVAIPHGTPHSRGAVLKTGVEAPVCPQGVDWGEEQTTYPTAGVAAQDDKHLDILRQLIHALDDDRMSDALTHADTSQAVLEILAGDTSLPAGEEPQPAPHFDEEAIFTLRSPHGLHARPNAALVKAVKQW